MSWTHSGSVLEDFCLSACVSDGWDPGVNLRLGPEGRGVFFLFPTRCPSGSELTGENKTQPSPP